MALKIEWSPEAKYNLSQTLNYLEKEWTDNEIRHFVKVLSKNLNLISVNPRLFKRSQRFRKTRECPITKHNSLFYTFDKDILYVVTFWDNRRNPKILTNKK